MLTVLTKDQIAAGAVSGQSKGLIEVRAAETTLTAGRGPTMVMLCLDEFGHVHGAGSTADSTAIYNSATPALAQCGPRKLILQTSSPWEKSGQLYASYCQTLECDPSTGISKRPSTLLLQLPSWDLYEDWAEGPNIPMWPEGPCFEELDHAVIPEDDEDIADLAESNPDTYAVEYLGHFRSSQDAYLSLQVVKDIFAPWQGRTLQMQTSGRLGTRYVAHVDPSVSGADTAVAIAHLETGNDGQPHVVFDHLHVWQPRDFPNGRISYVTIENELFELFKAFNVEHCTMDQFNSPQICEQLQQRLDDAGLPKRTLIDERRATHTWNWNAAELFKTAAGHGLIHAAYHDLSRLELEYLKLMPNYRVCAPTSGPVQRDDPDAMIACTYTLYEEQAPVAFERLSGLHLAGSRPAAKPTPASTDSSWASSYEPLTQTEMEDRLGGGDRISPHAEPRSGHRGAAGGGRFRRGRGGNF